jgi:hypothetical protein
MVAFFKRDGSSDAVDLHDGSEVRLNGATARASLLPPEHVYTASINRNCDTST